MSLKLAYPVGTPDTSAKLSAYRGKPEEVLAALRDIGYYGLELLVRDPQAMDTGEFRRVVDRCGFEVAVVGTGPMVGEDKLTFTAPDESVRAAAIERTKAVIDFAAQFRAQVGVGKLRGDIQHGDPAKSRGHMKYAFQILCEYAAKKQVTITVEPQSRFAINNLNTTQQALAFIQELALPNLRIMLDVFHMNIEDRSIAASLIEAKDHTSFLHFAENNRGVPGTGHLDFPEIIRVLEALQYDGYISLEIDQLPDSHSAAQASFEYLHTLIGGS